MGCKCTHELTYPNYCLVMDEVGGVNKRGDGHTDGEMCIMEHIFNSQQYSSCPWPHLPLRTHPPLMCMTIFSGKRHNPVLELGIDPFVVEVGSSDEADYMMKNMEKDKKI